MEEILKIISEERILLTVLTIMIVLDVITGLIKAVIEHDLRSAAFKTGLLKKIYDYILCLIGICLDYVLKVDYAADCCFYAMIAMEMYSCIENLGKYIPVPERISSLLATLNENNAPAKTVYGYKEEEGKEDVKG